ncbi:MAG: CoA-binding protein [Bacteroidales bacterium]|nr:CoA-binding protein [Bacteroidales bacterium]
MKIQKPQKTRFDDIRQFMSQKNIAIAGISRNDKKFGNTIFNELKSKNYKIFPLHQQMESYDGLPCFKDIDALPAEVTALIICTKPEKTSDLVHRAVEKGIRHIWLQQGAQDDEAIFFALSKGINIIHRQCALMFAEPVTSVHNFHRSINKLFGVYPK